MVMAMVMVMVMVCMYVRVRSMYNSTLVPWDIYALTVRPPYISNMFTHLLAENEPGAQSQALTAGNKM